jgi:hypothetical protein
VTLIELLYWEGCPSYPEAEALLTEVLRDEGVDAEVRLREVTTQAEAEALRFIGSPTIHVDGRDVDPEGAAQGRPALNCRVYRGADGRVSPVPSRAQIERALAVVVATR